MHLCKIAAVALAVLLIAAGAAVAAPGNAPTDGHAADRAEDNENASAHAGENDSEHAVESEAGPSENAPAQAAERGPPTDVSEQIPDHVMEIHDLVRQFVAGDSDGSLGEQISAFVFGGSSGAGA